MSCKIFVATHKDYAMPQSEIYMPVWAGAAINSNFKGQFQGDNDGDNISEKNLCFNELTVLYWGWKNIKSDYKGMVHYRRYIGKKKAVGG